MAGTGTKPFVIVSFPEETRHGKKIVDMVPTSWLTELPNEKWLCYYPPPEQKDVEVLVKEQVMPGPSWTQYPAEIVKKAGNYDQGIRRLERACETLTVESTTAENTDTAREYNSDEWEDENQARDIRELPKVSKKSKRSPSCVSIRTSHKSTVKQTDNLARMDEMEKNISRLIKGAKQSILYDFNKKFEELKNTVVVNQAPGVGTTLKQFKDTLGVKLPFTDDETFKEFNRQLKENDEKDAALRAVMVQLARGETDDRGAVRKILGGIMSKSVQELYSAAGRMGANGKTKQSLSATHVYDCMRDVVVELLPGKTAPAAILSVTSRYLSGAGDREGGKKARVSKAVMREMED